MFCTLSIEKYREYNSMFFDKRWYKDTSLLIAIVPCHHSQQLCKYIKMYINKYCYKMFMDKIFRLQTNIDLLISYTNFVNENTVQMIIKV